MRKYRSLSGCMIICLSFLIYPFVDIAAADEVSNYFMKAYNAHNLNDKITNYKKVIELDPNYIAAYVNLSLAYMENERFDEALTLLQQARRRDPENQQIRATLITVYINQGVSYSNAQRLQDAIKAFEAVLDLDPHNSKALGNLSAMYTNLGVRFYNQRDLPKAREAFCKALQIDPKNQTARNNLHGQDCPEPSPPDEDIAEMVWQAIAQWERNNGIPVNEKTRIVAEYLAAKDECDTDFRVPSPLKIEHQVSLYLDYSILRKETPAFFVCDPLQ